MYNLKDKKGRSWLFLSNIEDKVALYHKIQLGEILNLQICFLQQRLCLIENIDFCQNIFSFIKIGTFVLFLEWRYSESSDLPISNDFHDFFCVPITEIPCKKNSVHQCLGIGMPLPSSRKIGALLPVIFYKKPREV